MADPGRRPGLCVLALRPGCAACRGGAAHLSSAGRLRPGRDGGLATTAALGIHGPLGTSGPAGQRIGTTQPAAAYAGATAPSGGRDGRRPPRSPGRLSRACPVRWAWLIWVGQLSTGIARPEQSSSTRQQLGVRPGPQPGLPGGAQQVADAGVAEGGHLALRRQAGPAQRVPVVGGRVLEEDRRGRRGDRGGSPTGPGAGRRGSTAGPVGVQGGAVIPQPADLHPAPAVDLHVAGQAAARRTAPGRGICIANPPWPIAAANRVFGLWSPPGSQHGAYSPSSPVLPDRHDPGRDQVLHLVDGQHRVGLRVGAAVGDIDPGIAQQLLEQQRPDPAERPLDGLLVRRPQHPGGQDVARRSPAATSTRWWFL